MAIPIRYRSAPSGAIATFDFFDIAEGSGRINFFIASTTTNSFMTTDESLYSNDITLKEERNGSTIELSDIDYDISFNRPKIINGIIRISITTGANWGGSGIAAVFLVLNLYHVATNGTTETQIGAVDVNTPTVTANTTNNLISKTHTLEFDSGGKVHFKKDEILRLTIKHNGSGGNTTAITGYGIDPKDRNDFSIPGAEKIINDTETTQLKVQVPFVLTGV